MEEWKNADQKEAADIGKPETGKDPLETETITSSLETERDPCLIKVGDYTVKVVYSDCRETLNDRMNQYLLKMAEIKF